MNVAILGAGYLGKEVASLWSKKSHHVTVTTRDPDRLEGLSHVAQKCVILKDSDVEILAPLILENELLLVTIAASNPDNYESAYLKTAQAIRQIAFESQTIRRIIYISSTSVYGDHQGLWVDETSELKAKSDQAKILIETERVYESLREIGWHVSILRLAEIYGPERELSKRLRSLEGQLLQGTGLNYSNMIHKDDAVAAIDYTLRHQLLGTYNLADDDHPTRQELYKEVALKFKLPAPRWNPKHVGFHQGNKRISNHKIKAEGFTFRHLHRVIE
jgi:nucleoside-diphosphate-sugar epimerase